MRDFRWIVDGHFLHLLYPELLVTLAVLAAVLALTAVFVARELRDDREE